jgi:hypothetical protein
MAEGLSVAAANALLDSLLTTYPWAKLHVGAPGANGTANPAVETTRKQPTFGAATGALKTTTADTVWSAVAATEDFTHITFWTLSAGGSFGFSGLITANAMLIGDNFTIPIGELDVTFPVAS